MPSLVFDAGVKRMVNFVFYYGDLYADSYAARSADPNMKISATMFDAEHGGLLPAPLGKIYED